MVDNYIKAGKTYKVFLVEEDDDLRERVISARSRDLKIDYEPNYDDVVVDQLLCASKIFKTGETVTMTLELVPRADGIFFTIENFLEEDAEQ